MMDKAILNRLQPCYITIHANGRFYSFPRNSALDGWLQQRPKRYMGTDWSIYLHLLHTGKTKRLDTGSLQLGADGACRQLTIFARYRKRSLHWHLSPVEFSCHAFRQFSAAALEGKPTLVARLLKINAIGAIMQWLYEFALFRSKSPATNRKSPRTPTI